MIESKVSRKRKQTGEKVRSQIATQKYAHTHALPHAQFKTLSARTSARTLHVRKCNNTHMCAATQRLILIVFQTQIPSF